MEAASVAWHHLGWKPVAFSEIEPFPCAILKHHFTQPNYPYDVPNLGSLTEFNTWPLSTGDVDLLVGGTPCQSFSVAGKRGGLNDPRGQLMFSFLELAAKLQPKYVLWENVPGALSSGQPKGSDFGCLLQGLVERGYGVAYRILDAQHFGVPQRRRRVFVVAHRDPVTGTGDWRAAAEILSIAQGLRGYLAKGKQARKGSSADAESGAGADRKWPADTACTLNAAFGEKQGLEDQHALGGASLFVMSSGQANAAISKDVAHTLNATHETQTVAMPVCATGEKTHCLTASSGKGTTEDGTGRGTPIVIDRAAFNQGENAQYEPHIGESEVMDSLVARGPHAVGIPAMMFKIRGGSPVETGEQGGTPGKGAGKGFLGSEEKAFTIATSPDQWLAQPIAYSFDSLASNSMKSSNPNSGCREVDLAKTIDTSNACPSKNQGGIGIVQSVIPIQDGREMEKNQNGMGVGNPGDPAYTIDTTGAQAAAVPFRKSKRACSSTDNETWVEAEASNTLNNFDLGDTRTTHAVVQGVDLYNQTLTGDLHVPLRTAGGHGAPACIEPIQPQGFAIREDSKNNTFHAKPIDVSTCVTSVQASAQSHHMQSFVVQSCSDVAPTVTSSGPPYSRTGNERVEAEALVATSQPHIVQASELRLRGQITEKEVCPTLTADAKQGDTEPLAVHAISFQPGNLRRKGGADPSSETFPTLTKDSGDQSPHVAAAMAVRRLTPVECERLQGFPDNWSRISWKGKPAEECPDGPRYKACGNSMAVPVMRFIGEAIARYEANRIKG
jgi:DNA-cytosine methyltransferase